jgi:hypothetical protein
MRTTITGIPAAGKTTTTSTPRRRRTTTIILFGIRCENKYYQLEEMEDRDNCTTELFLTVDGTVEFGETDGPVWTAAVGQWSVQPGTDDFTMVVTRTFSTGRSKTDMGEFSYDIARTYVGEMTKVGDSVGITGVMYDGVVVADAAAATVDGSSSAQQPARQLGFFNMIDGTDIREDRRLDARVGVQSS